MCGCAFFRHYIDPYVITTFSFCGIKTLKSHEINGRFSNVSFLQSKSIQKSPLSCFLSFGKMLVTQIPRDTKAETCKDNIEEKTCHIKRARERTLKQRSHRKVLHAQEHLAKIV